MTPIDLSFLKEHHSDVIVKGEIFREKNKVLLLEDLLEIDLPSGRTIDVGWYPEHDVSGEFWITLYRGTIYNVVKESHTTNVDDLLQRLGDWVKTT